MKRIGTLMLSLLCLLALTGCVGKPEVAEMPKAIKGVLDLRDWDFKKNGTVVLKGEWEIYWMQTIRPDTFHRTNGLNPAYIAVPGSWNGLKVGGQTVRSDGYATYRLKVLMRDSAQKQWAFKVGETLNPNAVWINWVLVNLTNEWDFNIEKRNHNSYKPYIYKTDVIGDEFEIVIRMQNNNHFYGGMQTAIVFGLAKQVMEQFHQRAELELFIAGIIFIIALYHLVLFVLNIKDRGNLYFALFSLIVCIRVLITGENVALWMMPSLPWIVEIKLEALSFYGLVIFIFLYISRMYSDYFHKWAVRIIIGYMSLICGIVIFASPQIYPAVLIPTQIVTILIGIYTLAMLVRSYFENKLEVILFAGASVVLLAVGLNDILVVNNVNRTADYLLPYGMVFFIFVQSVVISMRSAQAYKEVERLSLKLERQKFNLETVVEERTRLLTNQKMMLEAAQSKMEQDLKMAAHFQLNVLRHSLPDFKQWDIAYYFKPMEDVSGDFYDFYYQDNELQGIGIFDVCGHGVSAGLVTMIARNIIFRAFRSHIDDDLGEVFTQANRDLIRELENSDYFLTGLILRFKDGNIESINAGHPPLIKRKAQKICQLTTDKMRNAQGKFLGFFKEELDYKTVCTPMNPGESILLYTDGLVEAFTSGYEEYGTERLEESLEEAPTDSAQAIIDAILVRFYEFIKTDQLGDDLTAIVIRRKD